jgi:hypothetical protein
MTVSSKKQLCKGEKDEKNNAERGNVPFPTRDGGSAIYELPVNKRR